MKESPQPISKQNNVNDHCRHAAPLLFTATLLGACLLLCYPAAAVTSNVTRHSNSREFLQGRSKDVVISSIGTIQLGREASVLVEKFENVWSVNTIVVSGGTVYLGTSPNGGIYKFSLGQLTSLYPAENHQPQPSQSPQTLAEPANQDTPADANKVQQQEYLTNEHIFAMTTDVSGRLLAGISGRKCMLCRLEEGRMKTIFEPNDAKYIFDIALADNGDIYLGTGPEGKIYRLDSFGNNPKMIYDSEDKNILCLTVREDGLLYAGSDTRGLVYKIDPKTNTVRVLYDSEQPEITSLLVSPDENLYAAATSAGIRQTETEFAAQQADVGRPEATDNTTAKQPPDQDVVQLQIANKKQNAPGKPDAAPPPPQPQPKAAHLSHIYKISKAGFVTDIFSEAAVFFDMHQRREELFVATGNKGQLYIVQPPLQQAAIIYEDQQASQVTSVTTTEDAVYLGTANPAKLVKLTDSFAPEGTYTSSLIDASQPAKWGTLQVEADIPQNCRLTVSSRSGNVHDVNDPTFSPWTEPAEITGPVQLRCPNARFCQYKLVLQSTDGKKTPVIRAVAVAATVPNLAPVVEAVNARAAEEPQKAGIFNITYKATDANADKLTYTIDFRKLGRTGWIQIKDDIQSDKFEWNSKTVEDGRYELRVTATDEKSNTSRTALTGSRVSEPVVVDNTGPVVRKSSIIKQNDTVTLTFTASDEFSAIGQAHYTLNSNDQWQGLLPDDLVYDTTNEDFTIVLEQLTAGEHILAVKVSDDLGNTTYRTFEVHLLSD